MKKFVNDPRQFVPEFLEGIQLASGGALKYEPKYNLIYRADMPQAGPGLDHPGLRLRATSRPTR